MSPGDQGYSALNGATHDLQHADISRENTPAAFGGFHTKVPAALPVKSPRDWASGPAHAEALGSLMRKPSSECAAEWPVLHPAQASAASQPAANWHLIDSEVDAAQLALLEVTARIKDMEAQPSPSQIVAMTHTDDQDPLGDVLDWLGRSELGKDDRFVPPDVSNKDLDALMDPDAPYAGDPRELGRDASIEKGGLQALRSARAQLPRARPPKLKRSHLEVSPSCPLLPCPAIAGSPPKRDVLSEEEDEWASRQQRTGTVGRLVIYAEGDTPQDDLLLRGGHDHHLVVAAVRDNGPASRAGVKAGDRLVSIDGKKDFMGASADSVRDLLRAPTIIVFLGFVGKLQAEVRLSCASKCCGLSTRHQVARGYTDRPVQVCEEVIFNAGIASLFLATGDESPQVKIKEPAENSTETHAGQLPPNIPMFELQRGEAHALVKSALRRYDMNKTLAAFGSKGSGRGSGVMPSSSDSAAVAAVGKHTSQAGQPGGDDGPVDDEKQLLEQRLVQTD